MLFSLHAYAVIVVYTYIWPASNFFRERRGVPMKSGVTVVWCPLYHGHRLPLLRNAENCEHTYNSTAAPHACSLYGSHTIATNKGKQKERQNLLKPEGL